MSYQQSSTPIESNTNHWPITKLHKNQKDFLADVVYRSVESLRSHYSTDESLYQMLAQTVSRELTRIASDSWVCDPKDDRPFWEAMDYSIKHKKKEANTLLEKIIERYVGEIRSNFSVRHYQLIAKITHHTLVGLLKPNCFGPKPKAEHLVFRFKKLQEKFHLTGEIETVRVLAEKGTIILVPTHSSHWDSFVIGFAMQRLGLPPLSWGTGLNLFNNKAFRYIFSKLGTYKVDRRKKTIPYLQTQKHYACLTLEWGCHTLFYPSGTRSRSGTIESNLKLGLLGTLFEAQERNFQKYGVNARKLFIVPIVLNYHCVLEAHRLIRESAQLEGVIDSSVKPNCCYTNLILSKNILLKGSEIFINIGTPLDVMGNRVDIEGHSYDTQDKEIDLYKQFINLPAQATTRKRSNDQAKLLSHKIVETYYRINIVLSSHVVAFAAYELAKTIKGFSMKPEKITLKHEAFMAALSKAYNALYKLYKQKKIALTPLLLHGQIDAIASDGLSKLGIYHVKPPLAVIKDRDLLIQDLWTLYYYHNRLVGYGLEKLFIQ